MSSWWDDAACRDVDTEAFFPVKDDDERSYVKRAALSVCDRCPVREPCLTKALRDGAYGIWGGTTQGQRAKMGRLPSRGVGLSSLRGRVKARAAALNQAS